MCYGEECKWAIYGADIKTVVADGMVTGTTTFDQMKERGKADFLKALEEQSGHNCADKTCNCKHKDAGTVEIISANEVWETTYGGPVTITITYDYKVTSGTGKCWKKPPASKGRQVRARKKAAKRG